MMKIKTILSVLLLFITVTAFPQKVRTYQIDLSHVKMPEITDDLKKFSGTSPNGTTLGVNNVYFTKNGKPWFPLMGEFHYVRYPRKYWEEEILKMKAAGINIVATYIFWNAHEYQKGHWNWSGNKDLRYFIELCEKHGMYVWLRIGPWAHGEQLYGGHPKWINGMHGKRKDTKKYLSESRQLYRQIANQTKGLYFKDGGPIIGVQLENEYAGGQKTHISTLKKMALEVGITPVYFSVTGNTVANYDDFEVIPLQGAYAYRGWEKAGGGPTKDFLYGNDQWIMTDALGKIYYDISKFPKGMCEQGSGSQQEYKNRFVVKPEVIEAHLQNQIGRSMNMIGYYMFQGGTQMPGLKEPGCPENYDFQAPISEFGFIRPSYKYLKILHNFIRDFGEELVTMPVVEPENPVRDEYNTKDLRYVARADDNGRAFLFLNNTQVRIIMPDKVFRMKVILKNDTITFPRKPMVLKGEQNAMFPINLNANGSVIKYATAQPLSRIEKNGVQYLFFTEIDGTKVEFALDNTTVKDVKADNWDLNISGNITYLTPSKRGLIELTSFEGKKSVIILLTRKEAENSWRTTINGKEYFLLTNSTFFQSFDTLHFRQFDTTNFNIISFPELKNISSVAGSFDTAYHSGIFYHYKISQNKTNLNIETKINGNKASVTIPGHLPVELSDIALKIKYLGSITIAYINDSLLTDNLFNGTDWLFGVKRFVNGKQRKIDFVTYPWKNNITGVHENLVKKVKKKGPVIENITVMPQYEVILKSNNE